MPTDRVAILGGTFDPIHNGHLAVIGEVVAQLHADAGWLLVAGAPQLRDRDVTPADIRLEMVGAAAIEGGWQVCDVEVNRPGPTFTIDTAQELSRRHRTTRFDFIVGADVARQIRAWHRSAELLAFANIVIVNRAGVNVLGGDEVQTLGFSYDRTIVLRVDSPRVSGTEIRSRVARGGQIGDLVPASVAQIIRERGLYQSFD